VVPDTFHHLEPACVPGAELQAGARADWGLVPAFRAGSRQRFRAVASGQLGLAEWVLLDARFEGLADLHPDGTRQLGAGDLELGALVRLPLFPELRGAAQAEGRLGPAVALGWRGKLPNAADEGELGSDETDLTLLALAAADLGPLRFGAGGGLAILGNPLMMAAQDDVAFLQVWADGPDPRAGGQAWLPRPRLGVDLALPTVWNPVRGELWTGLLWGERWQIRLEGGLGLAPASSDAWVGVGLGTRMGPWPRERRDAGSAVH